jgi:hypothetical protein
MSLIKKKAYIGVFDMKKHERRWLFFNIMDNFNNGIDLTSIPYGVTLRNIETGDRKIDHKTTGVAYTATIPPDSPDDITKGKGHYEWASGETNQSGEYEFEIDFFPAVGGQFTYGPVLVVIHEDADNK